MAADPASYGMTDTMCRMHGDAQFTGSYVSAHDSMMVLIGAGYNPQVLMTAMCCPAQKAQALVARIKKS